MPLNFRYSWRAGGEYHATFLRFCLHVAPLSGPYMSSIPTHPYVHQAPSARKLPFAQDSSLCIRYSTSTSFVRGITKSLYMATTASTLILLCASPTASLSDGSVP